MNVKKCYKCNEIKELNHFNKNRGNSDGYQKLCRECDKNKTKAWRDLPHDLPSETKICRTCKLDKPSAEFYKSSVCKDGLCTECKNCSKIKSKMYRDLPPDYEAGPTKKCLRCDLCRPSTEFDKNSAGKDGLRNWCKNCAREDHFQREYGIDLKKYNQMIEEQNNLCAICLKNETTLTNRGKISPLCVDHCHSTGRIRGLLCRTCNSAIGLFEDDPELLLKAYNYLKLPIGIPN